MGVEPEIVTIAWMFQLKLSSLYIFFLSFFYYNEKRTTVESIILFIDPPFVIFSLSGHFVSKGERLKPAITELRKGLRKKYGVTEGNEELGIIIPSIIYAGRRYWSLLLMWLSYLPF